MSIKGKRTCTRSDGTYGELVSSMPVRALHEEYGQMLSPTLSAREEMPTGVVNGSGPPPSVGFSKSFRWPHAYLPGDLVYWWPYPEGALTLRT